MGVQVISLFGKLITLTGLRPFHPAGQHLL